MIVPFAPLPQYFKDYLNEDTLGKIENNFIVNIKHGGYTPVQTRTKIDLAPEVENDFKTVAIYTVFLKGIDELVNGMTSKSYFIDNYYSKAPAIQLHFTEYDIFSFNLKSYNQPSFVKYTPFMGQPTIVNLINQCINIIGDEPLTMHLTEVSDLINETYKSPYENVNQMVKNIVFGWLGNKNATWTPPKTVTKKVTKFTKKTTKQTEESEKSKEEIEEEEIKPDVPDPEFQKIISIWVDLWWDMAKKSNIKGYGGKIPGVVVASSEKNKTASGFFDPLKNNIFINTLFWSKRDRNNLLKAIKKNNYEILSAELKNNKVWNEFFAYQFPCATIPHELEHSRRDSSHLQGTHDSIYKSLFPGDVDKERTFDQGANAIYEKLLAQGFMIEFLNRVNNGNFNLTTKKIIKKTKQTKKTRTSPKSKTRDNQVGVIYEQIKDWKNASYKRGNRSYHGKIMKHLPNQKKVVLKLFAPKGSIGQTFTIPYSDILRQQPSN